jgi:hypothetical protein
MKFTECNRTRTNSSKGKATSIAAQLGKLSRFQAVIPPAKTEKIRL